MPGVRRRLSGARTQQRGRAIARGVLQPLAPYGSTVSALSRGAKRRRDGGVRRPGRWTWLTHLGRGSPLRNRAGFTRAWPCGTIGDAFGGRCTVPGSEIREPRAFGARSEAVADARRWSPTDGQGEYLGRWRPLSVRLLGGVSASWNGRDVHLPTRGARALLALLAVQQNPRLRQSIADDLGPMPATPQPRGCGSRCGT